MKYESIPCNCGHTPESAPSSYEAKQYLANFDGQKEIYMPYQQCKTCHMIAMKQAIMELEDIL